MQFRVKDLLVSIKRQGPEYYLVTIGKSKTVLELQGPKNAILNQVNNLDMLDLKRIEVLKLTLDKVLE